MKSKPCASCLFAAAALVVATSLAQAQGLTREQVKSELAEAMRNGDFIVSDLGLKAYELTPDLYPQRPVVAGNTRGQVLQELTEARRNGDLIHGEKGKTAYEMAPHRYPARPAVAGRTRAQVIAELQEAIRLGDAPLSGEDALSPAERHPQRFSAVRAAHALAGRQE